MYKNINFLSNLGDSKRPGLHKIRNALSFFGNPHLKLNNCILISGTNGKGTVANSLSSIFVKSGCRTGLYTSPHLVKINERLKINGKDINNKDLDSTLGRVVTLCAKEKIKLSYFEVLTCAAILYFYDKKTDINIFEVGLGGKFDATNIIKSNMAIITNIHKDHTEYLGDTIELIAKEKAGIVRGGGCLVTSAEKKGFNILVSDAKRKKASVFSEGVDFSIKKTGSGYYYKSNYRAMELESNLLGDYQMRNLALAIYSSEIFNERYDLGITTRSIKNALKNLFLPGRFQIVSKKPVKIIDTAHNVHAISNLVRNLKIFLKGRKINFLIGMLKDKRPRECIKIIKEISDIIYLVNVPNKRSFNASRLSKTLNDPHIRFISDADIEKIVNSKKPLIVTGSTYLIGYLFDKHMQYAFRNGRITL
ncbi:MAG: Mur ligase family protein [Thermodesulfobacteriota bacterium]|nr:Mur ligase family protein [Thermodesulfobacteriota bacterium]